ncbi:hypothetical protein [uncultured Roseobacter sp.]|uniref:hypothetical protein n=1 Tax=uncultured Roseobacter sp. TaxID=114847 RepID=UPI00261AFD6E|nr:hypothetical protein [uncultured Roseobacter sp.]
MDRWFDPSVTVINLSVPDLTAQQIVDEINTIAQSPRAARSGWLRTRWAMMTPTQRLAWSERRRGPLMIMWMRGGPDGFRGLGQSFSEALEEIDR